MAGTIKKYVVRALDSAIRKLEKKSRRRRYYSGANIDRLTAGWLATNTAPDDILKVSLKTLRGHSRELARNNDYMKRFLNLAKTNIVGPNGITLQSRVKDERNPEKLDKGAARRIEEGWAEFCQRGVCTVDGSLSMIDCQKLFVESTFRDGEIIVRKVKGWKGNRFRFALQFFEADHLDENLNVELKNGNEIRLGKEYDKWGRVVAFHILKKHPGNNGWTHAGNHYQRIPADEIIHGFEIERARQGRGVPAIVTAMTRLHHLGEYEKTELIASRIGSAKMGFFYSPDGDGYSGEDDEDDYTPISEVEPGVIEQLPEGVRFESFDPQHPVSAFGTFIKSTLRGIASGLNVSYVSLANDLEGVSYSSIRQGELLDRDNWRMYQTFVVEHFLEDVFEAWLEMALTTQAVRLPISKIDRFKAHVWRPRGWAWIDPAKETKSNVEAVTNGLKSLQDIANDQGRDIEEIFEQLNREKALAKQYGLYIPALDQGGKHENPASSN